MSSCREKKPLHSMAIDTELLEEGDLIFRMGLGVASQVVTGADKDAVYSHVGLIAKQNGAWVVVHAVPGEEAETGGEEILKMDSLALFLRSDRCCRYAVMRHDTTAEVRQKAAATALDLLPQKIPFDNLYDIEDTTKFYCTEFVHHVYIKNGVDISRGERHNVPAFPSPIIFPSDILMNDKLQEITKGVEP